MPTKKKPTTSIYTRQTLAMYARASWRYKKLCLLSLGLLVSAVSTNVIAPLFASHMLASLATGGNQAGRYLLLFTIAAGIGLTANRIGIAANMRLQSNVMGDLYDTMYRRLMQRSAGFYADRMSGKLVSDALDYVNSYGQIMTQGFIKGFGLISIIISGVLILLFTAWQIGLVVLLVLTVLTAWTILANRRRRNNRIHRLQTYKQLATHLSDTLINAITVKTFAREAEETAISQDINDRLKKLRNEDWVKSSKNENQRVSVVVLIQVAILFALLQVVKSNPAALASGIFAFSYSLTLLNRFYDINTITRVVDESILSASPMAEILNQPIEIQDQPGAKKLIINDGALVLDKVDFSYGESSSKVFDGLSLEVPAGQKIGLVGPSGGGKTTLTRLLLRFNDVTAGSISIDNQDIASITQASLRDNIAYVPQEPLLFQRSVLDNIQYGNPKASKAAIIEAAKKANAHDFIAELPKGYDTIVGERGVKLSGGQRQRVAIARAIIKDAPILVLDEATSALDSASEKLIQASLKTLMEGRTTLVIAHRLSTIKSLDRVVVIDGGKLVEDGTHTSLVNKKNGHYAALWAHQSGGFIK